MATKKDLTEAYAFSRRRLVTAFVSGAPGGREVEPARPGRTIVGGLALSVLLVAGAAVAGVFSPRVDESWREGPGLIISKESGAAYVITDVEEGGAPVLRPVINITSAKLILGADAAPTIIPDEYIDAEQRGEDIGILGAPANVPEPERLVDSGWTACAEPDTERGIRVTVSAEPEVEPAPGGALLVRVPGDPAVFVVATGEEDGVDAFRAYSYRVPRSLGRDNLLDALGLPEAGSADRVPEEWLSLFPRGGDLTRDAFRLDGAGDPASYATDQPGLERAEIGDVVTTGTASLLLTQDGPVDLDPFPQAVYLGSGDESVIEVAELPDLTRSPEPFRDAHWPADTVTQVLGQQCAQLSAAAGQRPGVQVVTTPLPEAPVADETTGDPAVRVDAGAGAYVLSGGWDQVAGGEPHLVDAKGQRYPLVGPDTAERLGYSGYPVPNVPDAWLELFDAGVALSQNAALCPPTPRPRKSCA